MRIGNSITSSGGLISVSVVVGGVPQALYRDHDGQVWVVGRFGQSYGIKVSHLHAGRVEVISSVDGRNTLKNERADLTEVTGLIFRGTYTFKGFREDDQEVSAFVFCEPDRSAAAQAGDPGNIGVIGIAAYREKPAWTPMVHHHATDPYPEPWPAPHRHPRYKGLSMGGGRQSAGSSYSSTLHDSSASVEYGPPMAVASPGLGTGLGETISDPVGKTTFTREGEAESVTIRYDTEANLRARGILTQDHSPQAFPSNDEPTGYSSVEHVR